MNDFKSIIYLMSKFNQKGFIPLIALVLIFVIGGTGLVIAHALFPDLKSKTVNTNIDTTLNSSDSASLAANQNPLISKETKQSGASNKSGSASPSPTSSSSVYPTYIHADLFCSGEHYVMNIDAKVNNPNGLSTLTTITDVSANRTITFQRATKDAARAAYSTAPNDQLNSLTNDQSIEFEKNKKYTLKLYLVSSIDNPALGAPITSTDVSTNCTPSATTKNIGATFGTESVTISINRGETKKNIFSFTSTGATGFTLYGYPTTFGAGINWNPSSGGMSNGQTVNADLSISSDVPVGTYTGVGLVKLSPSNTQKEISFSVTVTEPTDEDMKFTFSTKMINVTIPKGSTSETLLTYKSTGSTSFTFFGYPTDYGPGINWGASSGGISNGNTYNQTISVNSNTPSGTYHGNPMFRDGSTGAETTFDVTVIVP